MEYSLLDYRSAKNESIYILINELTEFVRCTRKTLKLAFFESFFCRYTKRHNIQKDSYVPKMCMFFYPVLKNLSALRQMVRACNLSKSFMEPVLTQNVKAVVEKVESNIKKIVDKGSKVLVKKFSKRFSRTRCGKIERRCSRCIC